MVGQTTESMEPCWASFLNTDLDTNMEDKVTHFTDSFEKIKPSPKFPKLDIELAQSICEKTLETPEIEMPSVSLDVSNVPIEDKELLKTSVDITNVENSVDKFDAEMEIDSDGILIDGIDCVVNEEVVETTEYVDPCEKAIPNIVLTEVNTIDLISDDEGMLDTNLLKPKDILEESNSDYGYESYDSPISEPEELVNLFPELW